MAEISFSDLCGFSDKQWTASATADSHAYTLFGGSRGPGKALALDTPIPTPDGWTTMGDLAVGDSVIGRDGQPCLVTWISPIWTDRPCYRVAFDDGSAIVADAEHEWLVFSRDDRRALVHRTEEWRAARRAKRPGRGTGKKPWLAELNSRRAAAKLAPPTGSIRTTRAIVETLTVGKEAETNWSVPTCAAYDVPDVELPLDPYVLGVWLGDGTATMGSITSADEEIIQSIRAAGFQITKWLSAEYAYNVGGLKSMVRRLGVYSNKHIPAIYLRASRAQRIALLQGLMDTDGYADKDGRVEFTNTNELLTRGLRELVLSLGYKATLRTGRATLDGRDCGPKWRVAWSADEPMFRLERKRVRQKTDGFNGVHRWRYIVACDPVSSVPVRCIEVDNGDHLYLAGESWIPTHNSYWLRWYAVRRLLRWAAQGHTGVRVMLACEDYPSLRERQIVKIVTEFPPWLGTYKISANDYVLRPEYGGGVIALRNLDDASKYQSAEYAGIAVDEITKNKERAFHILRGSLRWPGITDTYFVAASNPEANWVRDYWIEGKLPDELAADRERFAFVAALPEDNPHLPPTYWAMLDTLPGALRQAWRHGDWYAAVEGLVYENFGPENIVDTEPDPDLAVEMAIDDGYVDPRATLFIQRQANGDILVFDELYQTKTLEERTISDIFDKCLAHFGGGTVGEQLAAAGVEWDTSTADEKAGWCERLGIRVPELAAVSHEAVALQQRLRRANLPARNWLTDKAGGGQSTRLAAITLTRSLICDGQGYRAIKIHRRCRNLLDELGAGYKYPPGKHGLQTKPEDGRDHAANALESWVWLRARRG